jgi:hypothetical protein
MPPQQAYGLLDFVNDDLRFRAHCFVLQVGSMIGAIHRHRAEACKAKWSP